MFRGTSTYSCFLVFLHITDQLELKITGQKFYLNSLFLIYYFHSSYIPPSPLYLLFLILSSPRSEGYILFVLFNGLTVVVTCSAKLCSWILTVYLNILTSKKIPKKCSIRNVYYVLHDSERRFSNILLLWPLGKERDKWMLAKILKSSRS